MILPYSPVPNKVKSTKGVRQMLKPILFFIAAWFLMIVGICIPVVVQKLDIATVIKRIAQFLLFCIALMFSSMAPCFANNFTMKAIFTGVLLVTLLLCWQIDKLRQQGINPSDWIIGKLANFCINHFKW